MKVYVLPADVYGCGHYRLIWPCSALQQQGHDVVIMPPGQDSGFLVKVDGEGPKQRLKGIQLPTDADVIVLQRPAHVLQPQAIEMMRSNGIAVVIDMDDDMSSIHPDSVAYHMYSSRPKKPGAKGADLNWRYATESCKRATLVTTSTRALQRIYAPHGRGMVLDNYVPEACLSYPKPEPGKFGWAGTTHAHPNDLQVTGRAAQQLIDEGHELRIVGGPSKVRQNMRLDQDPDFTGATGVDEWVRMIAFSLDIGMVPLAKTAFNAAKSRLKGIEYMAAGVAWVASPREEYRKLHRESGCGFLADTPKEWYRHLRALLTDEILRKEQVERGRQYMKDQTYQAQAWRWAEAWTRALEIQRG